MRECARVFMQRTSHLASVTLEAATLLQYEVEHNETLFLSHTRASGQSEGFCAKIPSTSHRIDGEKPLNTPRKNLKVYGSAAPSKAMSLLGTLDRRESTFPSP